MRVHGRIPLCGAVSQYNQEEPPAGPGQLPLGAPQPAHHPRLHRARPLRPAGPVPRRGGPVGADRRAEVPRDDRRRDREHARCLHRPARGREHRQDARPRGSRPEARRCSADGGARRAAALSMLLHVERQHLAPASRGRRSSRSSARRRARRRSRAPRLGRSPAGGHVALLEEADRQALVAARRAELEQLGAEGAGAHVARTGAIRQAAMSSRTPPTPPPPRRARPGRWRRGPQSPTISASRGRPRMPSSVVASDRPSV